MTKPLPRILWESLVSLMIIPAFSLRPPEDVTAEIKVEWTCLIIRRAYIERCHYMLELLIDILKTHLEPLGARGRVVG